jgi:hypothetical protein
MGAPMGGFDPEMADMDFRNGLKQARFSGNGWISGGWPGCHGETDVKTGGSSDPTLPILNRIGGKRSMGTIGNFALEAGEDFLGSPSASLV